MKSKRIKLRRRRTPCATFFHRSIYHLALTFLLFFGLKPFSHAETNLLRFHSFMGAEGGRIYGVTSEGAIRFYWHLSQDGTPVWSNNSNGIQIGTGWEEFPQAFYNGNGIIYGVGTNGILYYFRDVARDGTVNWSNNGIGVPVGTEWNYKWVMGGGDGIIYAINNNGALLYFRHTSQNEQPIWSNGGVGKQIGSGWASFKQVISGSDGVFYAVKTDGSLMYYRDLARNGTINWENGGNGLKIGSGWTMFKTIFSPGGGRLYGVTSSGAIFYYRVTVSGTNYIWDYGGAGQFIATGFPPEALEGYCWPLSAAPGEKIDFKLSAAGQVNASIFRYKANAAGVSNILVASTNVFVSGQPIPPDGNRNGCNWTNSFSLTIPSNWVSGIYSAHCTNNAGETFYITFVVKPAPYKRSQVAVLANINTWNAYNSWGDGSKYEGRSRLSLQRPNPAASPLGSAHLVRGELWILGWLEDQGFKPDVYTDLDFHNGFNVGTYKSLVLNTHPEYWTIQMYTNLQTYLTLDGGSLFYLGGNGVYEVAEYVNNQTGMIYLAGVENGPREAALFRNLSPPKTERALLGVGYEAALFGMWAPFQVLQSEHPFFQGTGLSNGQTFGGTGLNGGGASGWEVDIAGPGSPAGLKVLARGLNSSGAFNGSDMIYYLPPGGGIVFSVGSISFGGSLVVDGAIQQILRNALTEALSPSPNLNLIGITTNSVQLSLRGRPGGQYLIESCSQLGEDTWHNVASINGNGTVQTLSLPQTESQQFYRAILQP